MTNRPSKKERRELAKQAQASAMRKAHTRGIRKRLLTLGFVLGGIALIVGFFVVQSSKGSKRLTEIGSLASGLGCSDLQEFESLGSEHVAAGEITYPRMPPESGNHRPTWAKTGEHTSPIESETQLHNLEHGQVILQYARNTPDAVVTALKDAMRSDPQWIIAAPYEEFTDDTMVAMTSWQHRIDCGPLEAGDADDIKTLASKFVEARKNKAPESIAGEVNEASDEDSSGG